MAQGQQVLTEGFTCCKRSDMKYLVGKSSGHGEGATSFLSQIFGEADPRESPSRGYVWLVRGLTEVGAGGFMVRVARRTLRHVQCGSEGVEV